MQTPTRLAIFGAGLVLAFTTAWGVGAAVSPILDPPDHTNDGTQGRDPHSDPNNPHGDPARGVHPGDHDAD